MSASHHKQEDDDDVEVVVFAPGPVGMQLEAHAEYNSRVVRFVDGFPIQPGPARRCGRIHPGDFIVQVSAVIQEGEGEALLSSSADYYGMLRILQKTHVERQVYVRSPWKFLAPSSSAPSSLLSQSMPPTISQCESEEHGADSVDSTKNIPEPFPIGREDGEHLQQQKDVHTNTIPLSHSDDNNVRDNTDATACTQHEEEDITTTDNIPTHSTSTHAVTPPLHILKAVSHSSDATTLSESAIEIKPIVDESMFYEDQPEIEDPAKATYSSGDDDDENHPTSQEPVADSLVDNELVKEQADSTPMNEESSIEDGVSAVPTTGEAMGELQVSCQHCETGESQEMGRTADVASSEPTPAIEGDCHLVHTKPSETSGDVLLDSFLQSKIIGESSFVGNFSSHDPSASKMVLVSIIGTYQELAIDSKGFPGQIRLSSAAHLPNQRSAKAFAADMFQTLGSELVSDPHSDRLLLSMMCTSVHIDEGNPGQPTVTMDIPVLESVSEDESSVKTSESHPGESIWRHSGESDSTDLDSQSQMDLGDIEVVDKQLFECAVDGNGNLSLAESENERSNDVITPSLASNAPNSSSTLLERGKDKHMLTVERLLGKNEPPLLEPMKVVAEPTAAKLPPSKKATTGETVAKTPKKQQPTLDFSHYSHEQVLVFSAGPLGMQIVPHHHPDYPAVISRFVDGGPTNPGQARTCGKLRPGDYIVRVEAEGIVATTYPSMLHLLQKSWTERRVTFRSAWDESFFFTRTPERRNKTDCETSTQSPTSSSSTTTVSSKRSTPMKDSSPLPYDWTPLPYDWVHGLGKRRAAGEELMKRRLSYELEAKKLIFARDLEKKSTAMTKSTEMPEWDFSKVMVGAVALTAESVADCLRPRCDTADDDEEEYHAKHEKKD